MSLVNYYSSSDDENSSNNGKCSTKSGSGVSSMKLAESEWKDEADKGILLNVKPKPVGLFASLPVPKSTQLMEETNNDDVTLKAASSSTHGLCGTSGGVTATAIITKKRSNQPVKITAPILPERTSDDDDDNEPSSKKAKPAKNYRQPYFMTSRLLDWTTSSSMTSEHTLEELVQLSRSAIEQLHKKIKHKQWLDSNILNYETPPSQVKNTSSHLQGTAESPIHHNMGIHYPSQLDPSLPLASLQPRATLHPMTISSGLLGNTTESFFTNSLDNHLQFDPMNSDIVGFQSKIPKLHEHTSSAQSMPLVNQCPVVSHPMTASQHTVVPQNKTVSPQERSKTSVGSGDVPHTNCCKACVKRIEVLEQAVKKILDNLNSKDLIGGGDVSLLNSFQVPTATMTDFPESAKNLSSTSNIPMQQSPMKMEDFQNVFLDVLPSEDHESVSGPSLSKLKVVYPHQTTDPPISMPTKSDADNERYEYQSLMRYKGNTCAQMSDSDPSFSSSRYSPEIDGLSQLKPVIYSAAIFESLPAKIQTVLDVTARDGEGNVTKVSVKHEVLASLLPFITDRGSIIGIARRLADALFTDDERCFCNCSGWRKPAALDPIRMQALTSACFQLFPSPEDKKKAIWHECVKSIDAASRHIVRLRKSQYKKPRPGKWRPFGTKNSLYDISTEATDDENY